MGRCWFRCEWEKGMPTISFLFFGFDSDLIGTSLAFVKEVYRVIKCLSFNQC